MKLKKAVLIVLLICGLCAVFNGCATSGAGSEDKDFSSFPSPVNPTVKERYTITFVQEGFPDVEVSVKRGGALTDFPTPQPVRGYTVTWERTELSDIQQDLTVNALVTANTYTITYVIGYEGATLDQETQEVVFGQEIELFKAIYDEYSDETVKIFVEWQIEGTNEALENGVYDIDGDITLIGVWTKAYGPNY